MDWLRQVLNQATAAFRAMTAAQRASMIMLGLTIAVALGLVAVMGARPKYVTLFSGLEQNDLGAVTRYLDESGEEYKVDAQKGEVLVPSDRKPSLYTRLQANRVVSQKVFDTAAYIENSGSLWISEKERQERLRFAVAGELQKTICGLQGVESCTVQVKPESADEFVLAPEKVGVGITVAMRGGQALDQQFANSVIDLASSVVRNADPKLVKVIDARDARRCFTKEDSDTEYFIGKNRLMLKSQMESYYQKKINELISATGYEGKALVTVELDLDKVKELAQEIDPEKTLVVYQKVHKLDSTGATAPGGAVGVDPNNPVAAGGAASTSSGSAGTPSKTKDSESETKTICSFVTKEIMRAPGKVAKITASVVINDRIIFKKNEKTGEVTQVYETPGEDIKANWKNLVAKIIGINTNDNTVIDQAVAICHWKPVREAPDAPAAAPKPDVKDMVAAYWPYARIGGVLMLTAVAFLFLYALGKRAATAPPPELVIQAPHAGAGGAAEEESGAEPDDIKLRQLQDKLRGMVSQDPRKVATLVKRWLTNEG